MAVKRTDKQSKKSLFSAQSAKTIKDLEAFWCFRRMTAKENCDPILKRAVQDKQRFGIKWVRTDQSSVQVIAAVPEWVTKMTQNPRDRLIMNWRFS
jgi:hypothetical protein